MIGALLAFRGCMARPFWAPERLRKYEDARLRRLVRHSYEHVPYYRRLFKKAGITPDGIRTIDDLHKIPISTKWDLMAVPLKDRVAENFPEARLKRSTTSGSTRMPFDIIEAKGSLAKKFLDHRGLFLCGYSPFDTMAQFEDPNWAPKSRLLLQRLGLFRKRHISIFAEEDEIVGTLARLKPGVAYGYPSNLRMAAVGILRRGVTAVRPHLLLTTSEVLDDATRAVIEGAFGVAVFDVFGTSEFGPFAWECRMHDGYHLSQDFVHTEFIKDGMPARPGEVGTIVCTGFDNLAMPLIRYQIGDTGIPLDPEQACPCGQRLPKMAVVAGRMVDYIRLGKRTLAPYIFTCLMEGIPGILQYQVVQSAPDQVEVRLDAAPAFRAKAESEILARYQSRFGGQLRVRVTGSDGISTEKNGKFKVVKSLLP